MKHTLKITLILMMFFILTQATGLYIINKDITVTLEDGEKVITHADTIMGERPDLEPKDSFISIVLAILVGTILALILIKLKLFYVWNIWFFFAVLFSSALALGVFLPAWWAFSISLVLTLLKYFKTNILTHNISELLIYPGIALIFVPILNVFWIIALLLVISLYDMYAVWKSKHMVKLAEFQSKSNKFAGFMIDYKCKDKVKTSVMSKKKVKVQTCEGQKAILGGGDIFFPLLFSGVFMEHLIVTNGLSKLTSLLLVFLVTISVSIALFLLFYKSEKGKYYPAMPFLSAGCMLGYSLVYIVLSFM